MVPKFTQNVATADWAKFWEELPDVGEYRVSSTRDLNHKSTDFYR